MYKLNEISTLYRTASPTLNPYIYDGEGRDMYIGFNNGGFWNKRFIPGTSFEPGSTKSNRYRFRTSSKDAVSFTYHSDGSGRDSYILINSGGLNRQSKPLSSYHLSDFLRGPDENFCKFKPKTPRAGSVDRFYVTRDEFKNNLLLLKKQKGIIDRLYNKEKYKFIPG